MKTIKRLIAVMIAAMMVLGTFAPAMAKDPVYAVNGDILMVQTFENDEDTTGTKKYYKGWTGSGTEGDPYVTTGATEVNADGSSKSPTGNLTADIDVTVSNLQPNDSVAFYKFIEWRDGEGWFYTNAFTTAAAGDADANPAIPAITLPDINTITGHMDTTTDPNNPSFIPGAISAADGATLATVAARLASPTITKSANNAGSAVYGSSDTPACTVGLYVALITPATADYLYNPIFVAADYSQRSTSPNEQAATLDKSYSDISLAKKEQVTLTKEINGTEDTKYDINVGDDVPFTITSKIPAFSSSYQNPTYQISDTMETGLVVKADTVPLVEVEGITLEAGDYTVVVAEDRLSFTVTMNLSGLAKVKATGQAKTITVTYTGTVTTLDDDHVSVTEKKNTATVKFSNHPTNSSSYSLLEDKTRNYTFTIDGNLLGKTDGSYETSELIKVGLDEQGNWLLQTVNYRSGSSTTELSPLENAVFTLYDALKDQDEATADHVYTNSVFNTGTVTSDANGRLLIEGLDAGTYYLKETTAPAGFIKDNRTFKIVIAATYKTIPAGSYTNSDGILVNYDSYKVLDSYTVTVSALGEEGTAISTYDIINDATDDNKIDVKVTQAATNETTGNAGDVVTPINNTRGTELPSTGGIGTTLFYAGGAILVLLAGILLVSKRRAA